MRNNILAIIVLLLSLGSFSNIANAQVYQDWNETKKLSPGYHIISWQSERNKMLIYVSQNHGSWAAIGKQLAEKDGCFVIPSFEGDFIKIINWSDGYVDFYTSKEVPLVKNPKRISDNWAWGLYNGGAIMAFAKYKKGVKPYAASFDEDKWAARGITKGHFWKDVVWGLADIEGDEILNAQYDSIALIHNDKVDYALIMKGGKWGKVDSKGNTVIPMGYEWLGFGDYDIDNSIVTRFIPGDGRHKIGLMTDVSCKILLPAEYDDIKVIGNVKNVLTDSKGNSTRVWRVNKNGKFGLYGTKGEMLIDSVCDSLFETELTKDEWEKLRSITNNYDKTLFLCKGGKWGIVEYDGSVIIPVVYDSRKEAENAVSHYKDDSFKYFCKKSGLKADQAEDAFIMDKMLNIVPSRELDFYISRYDILTHCFIIRNRACPGGEFPLSVPMDEAVAFKKNFDTMKVKAIDTAKYCVYNDLLSLSEFTFTSNDGKVYEYHNSNAAVKKNP